MHAIDINKGSLRGEVSRQWAMRPDDEKFLSLSALRAQVLQWREQSFTEAVKPNQITALYDKEIADFLQVAVGNAVVDASHYAFGQIASIAGAPANYLRTLPGPLAAMNLNYGLKAAEQKLRSAYLRKNGGVILRGVTGTKYGRIFDSDVVEAVMKIAGDGTGDTRWKVPGTIEWGSEYGVAYNPNVDITKETTTLYASDRDVFLFLVDDRNPIEVGVIQRPDGTTHPDLMFRGFYTWNSEVGQRTFGVATMYLRGVCQNRNLWGVEGFSEVTFKHTTGAPERFVQEAAPALQTYAETASGKLVAGVAAAKAAKVATTDEERIEFLAKFGFSQKQATVAILTLEAEEERKPESIWDMAQAVTAMARKETFQDKRLHMEIVAGKMLDKVKA